MVAVALGLGSSLCWGLADFLGGLQTRRRHVLAVLLVSQAAGCALALLVAAAVGGELTSEAAAWAAGAGVAGVTALGCFYRGLAIGTMSIVAPVSAIGACVPVIVGLAGGERPGALQAVGIAVAFVGIVLASREEAAQAADGARAALALALCAALGFGLFFVGIDQATQSSEALPVIAVARIASFIPLLAVFLAVWPGLAASEGSGSFAPLLLVGALDASANGLFALATQQGLLSVVAVLGSLYPAVTVVLARFVLSERVTRLQELGVVLALAGVIAISAG